MSAAPPTATPTSTRAPAIAGTFYPATAAALNAQLDVCFAARVVYDGPAPKAIIAPHAGLIYSGPVAASAYAALAPDAAQISRVVLLGPSHHVGFRGFVVPEASLWQTPLGTVPIDTASVQQLAQRADVQRSDAPHAPEHSLEVHLPFLQRVLGTFELVPVLVGQISPEQGASLIDALWGGAETRVVISSDLSHFFSQSKAQTVDAQTTAIIEGLDADAMLHADACGRYPTAGLLHLAKRRGMRETTLDVRTSADTAGDPSRVVGYGAYLLHEHEATIQRKNPEDPGRERPSTPPSTASAADRRFNAGRRRHLCVLARRAIRDGLARGATTDSSVRPPRLDLSDAPGWLREHGATFVTLNRPHGHLRGCIGTLAAYQALGQDVVDHAFAAAFRDPRFPPLSHAELDGLSMHLSVLSAPEPFPARDETDACARLRPGVDGVVLSSGNHRATFLPQVWESLPDPHDFLAALRQKAGLPPGHWPVTLQTYTVQEWGDDDDDNCADDRAEPKPS